MRPFFHHVTDLTAGHDLLERRRYGMIEVVDQQLAGIWLRPLPKIVSVAEVWWNGRYHHQRVGGDRCRLYYNQPLSAPGFLTLMYAVSNRGTSLRSIRGALKVLDAVARIKQVGAIVTEVSNLRISDRLLERWGWERHVPDSPRRHYIRRFYGDYPEPDPAWLGC